MKIYSCSHSWRFLILLFSSFICACIINTGAQKETVIACQSDFDCPTLLPKCSARKQCFDPLENLAPAIAATIPSIGARPLDGLNIQFSLTDPNGAPDGDDTASVAALFRVGDDGDFFSAVLEPSTQNLTTSITGENYALR